MPSSAKLKLPLDDMYRYITDCSLGCHVSALLKEERKLINKEMLKEIMEDMKMENIVVEFTGIEVYEKFDDKKGWMWLVALTVESDDILNFREKLDLPRKPKKMTLHCTLLEKIVDFE